MYFFADGLNINNKADIAQSPDKYIIQWYAQFNGIIKSDCQKTLGLSRAAALDFKSGSDGMRVRAG